MSEGVKHGWRVQLEKVKTAMSAGHIALVLAGAILTAGIAWGTGTQRIEEHEKRIEALEQAHSIQVQMQREDFREMRQEMNTRFNSLEQLLRAGK